MMQAKEENKEGFEFLKSRMLSLEFSQSLKLYHRVLGNKPKNFSSVFLCHRKPVSGFDPD
jgi:hypothetical protein